MMGTRDDEKLMQSMTTNDMTHYHVFMIKCPAGDVLPIMTLNVIYRSKINKSHLL